MPEPKMVQPSGEDFALIGGVLLQRHGLPSRFCTMGHRSDMEQPAECSEEKPNRCRSAISSPAAFARTYSASPLEWERHCQGVQRKCLLRPLREGHPRKDWL